MKKKLLYTAIFLITFYLSLLYNYPLMRFLLAFELILPLLLFLTLLCQRAGLCVRFSMEEGSFSKNAPIPVEIRLINKGFLPIPSIRAKLTVRDRLLGDCQEVWAEGAADISKSSTIRCRTFFPYCARLDIALETVRIQDFLGLFSLKVKAQGKGTASVLPTLYALDISVSEQTRNHPVEALEYDTHRAGDDVSEIYQVREYQGGDTLGRVHWKLSAKEDQLMVKDFGMPRGCAVLLLLDFYLPAETEDRRTPDAFLDTAVSLSFSMAEAGCMHQILWLGADGRLRRRFITQEEEVSQLIPELMSVTFYQDAKELLPLYHSLYPQETYAAVLSLDTRLVLQRNGINTASFNQDNLKENLEGFPLMI